MFTVTLLTALTMWKHSERVLVDEMMGCIYNAVLFSLKKEGSSAVYNNWNE